MNANPAIEAPKPPRNQSLLTPAAPGERPNEAAISPDFEFEPLRLASNYRQAILSEFADALRGHVLEVGAGIGQNTAHLIGWPKVESLISVEPDAEFCTRFRQSFPGQPLFQGTVESLPAAQAADTLISINVLEHILDDAAELGAYARLLGQRQGRLCLFVPARPELYAPLDKDFGHHRRYARADLKAKLQKAGFEIIRLHYFNFAGYFAWWLNFCVLRKRHFNPTAVRIYDRWVFPPCHAIEKKLVRPPIGQSLVAVAVSQGRRTWGVL